MLEDSFLDEPDEFEFDTDWYREARLALLEYLGTVGHCEFTSADFRRWAEYYTGIGEPSSGNAWSILFRRAGSNRLIKYAGRSKSGRKTIRWVAA